jgi:hypothetical protein
MIDPAIVMEYRHALRLTYLGLNFLGLQLHFGERRFVCLSGYRKVMRGLIGMRLGIWILPAACERDKG